MKKLMGKSQLEKIWYQVPPDYYQQGIRKNFLQRVWHGGKWRVVAALIPENAGEILDLGCAGGHITAKIKKILPKAEVTGVDVYEPSIRYAQNKYKNIHFLVSDAHKLPFKNESFDLIICTETIEHVSGPKEVLLEIKRCLTDDGRAIIEMDTGNFLFNWVWFFWTRFGPGRVWRGSHINHLAEDSLERLIRKSGLAIKKKVHTNLGMAVFFEVKK